MKINWKLRIQNKTTLLALASTCVAFVYSVLSALGVVPSIGQEQVLNIIGVVVSILAALGIVVDPTTEGISDSKSALAYEQPKAVEEKSE